MPWFLELWRCLATLGYAEFCSAKWGIEQEIWNNNNNNKKASATSSVIWKTEWKSETLLPVPCKWVNYVPLQSFMSITFTKGHSCRMSDQSNLMASGHTSSREHFLLTINPQEMSSALVASILKKKGIDLDYVNRIPLLQVSYAALLSFLLLTFLMWFAVLWYGRLKLGKKWSNLTHWI